MIKRAKISIVVLMGSTILLAGTTPIKLYDVKSGKIEYEIKGSGNIMGMIKTKTIGKKRVIFDVYGAQNLTEENKVSKETTEGKTKVTKTHTLTYMKNAIMYKVLFDKKRIIRMENPALAMAAMMGAGTDMKNTGESIMKSMGGKKTGTDKVAGYTCDVWELMGTRQCIYKGITLKVETDMMGIKNAEIATKAEFDLALSEEDFKLPDFPIYDIEGNKLDKNNLDAMDQKAEKNVEKSSQEMAEIKQVIAEAAKNAGIKEGERPTKAQEEAMKNSMMEAMLPLMKQKMLAEEEMMRIGYECLSKADTLKEANVCNDKVNAMGGEAEEPFDEWSPKTKQETLEFIDKFVNEMIPCVKKAKTMQEARQCMVNAE
jgi:hypothetical protein